MTYALVNCENGETTEFSTIASCKLHAVSHKLTDYEIWNDRGLCLYWYNRTGSGRSYGFKSC